MTRGLHKIILHPSFTAATTPSECLTGCFSWVMVNQCRFLRMMRFTMEWALLVLTLMEKTQATVSECRSGWTDESGVVPCETIFAFKGTALCCFLKCRCHILFRTVGLGQGRAKSISYLILQCIEHSPFYARITRATSPPRFRSCCTQATLRWGHQGDRSAPKNEIQYILQDKSTVCNFLNRF
jgi:hypothetical protein